MEFINLKKASLVKKCAIRNICLHIFASQAHTQLARSVISHFIIIKHPKISSSKENEFSDDNRGVEQVRMQVICDKEIADTHVDVLVVQPVVSDTTQTFPALERWKDGQVEKRF